jgi:GNAT superfamily N-acetyltransferase
MLQASRSPSTINLRPATRADVPRLVTLNHVAYPDLVEEGVVWSAAQLESHLDVFARGQIVAEAAGALVGAISTFVVSPRIDALAPHTWLGITGGGWLTTHDPNGETLYLADVYVDPSCWGRGVGGALYAALFSLCNELGLARVVAGGRLWGYHEYASQMTADEYARRVAAGQIRDRVLRSQLKAGFALRGILPGYLRDPRSGDFATLLEWRARDAASGKRRLGRSSETSEA